MSSFGGASSSTSSCGASSHKLFREFDCELLSGLFGALWRRKLLDELWRRELLSDELLGGLCGALFFELPGELVYELLSELWHTRFGALLRRKPRAPWRRELLDELWRRELLGRLSRELGCELLSGLFGAPRQRRLHDELCQESSEHSLAISSHELLVKLLGELLDELDCELLSGLRNKLGRGPPSLAPWRLLNGLLGTPVFELHGGLGCELRSGLPGEPRASS